MTAQRGYSYLAVLFLVALTAAALAALGQAWSTAAQRERERELQFRGEAIAAAITRYEKAGVTAQPELPRTLDDLLEDRRGGTVRRHLRQRYVDPFTGEANWELLPRDTDRTRFHAVRSRSSQALLRARAPDGTVLHKASDWVFVAPALEGRQTPAGPASAASEPPPGAP
jgi:type II secretory pathway pseudopilin PulG